MKDSDSIPTRRTLLARLKNWDDQESWREFFELYWRLIQATALKAGLTDAEAKEVVQEVVIAVAKKMPEFRYEPGKDSLKGWLLGMTRWKIGDQFRKRPRELPPLDEAGSVADDGTATLERVPDPNAALDQVWESEWRENLLRGALDRVKARVNPAHYEMYHLHVIQEKTVAETAALLKVSRAAVYLAKHRVGSVLKQELSKRKLN